MDVILSEDVQGLGDAGAIVKVKPGYARNYLIPQSLAVEATTRNLKELEHQKGLIARHAEKRRVEFATLAEKIAGLSITVPKPVGEADKLYGSVTAKDVVAGLVDEGVKGVDKKAIVIAEPIRSLGIFDLPIRLSAESTVDIKLWVVAK